MSKLKGYRKLKKQAEEDRQAGMIPASSASSLLDYQAGIVSEAITALENIQEHWKNLIPGAHQGYEHTEEARKKISNAGKALWQDPAFRDKMWRSRRARQFREKGKCLIRFPRLSASADKSWLRTYEGRYRKIVGERPATRFYSGN